MLHIETKGQPGNPTVLLIHGLLGAARNLRRLADGLAQSGFFTVSYDQRGHGHSSWSPDYTLPELAKDAISVLDRFNVEKAHWVGHSMGGRVCIAASGRAPERFLTMTLMDVGPTVSELALNDIREIIEPLPEAYPSREAAEKDLASKSPMIKMFLLSNLRRTSNESELRWTFDLKGLRRFLNLGIQIDQSAFLRQARFPIHIIRGENSRHVTPDELSSIVALNPERITSSTVPAAGHWIHADNHESTLDLLRGFLEKYK